MSEIKTTATWNGKGECISKIDNAPEIKVVGKGGMDMYPGTWSPVHMLVAAAETCFVVTLLAIAERARIEIKSIKTECLGTIGLIDDKHSAVTGITLKPTVQLANEADRSKLPNIYQKAEEYCTVGNSLNFKIHISA